MDYAHSVAMETDIADITHLVTVSAEAAGGRLDRVLADALPMLSRSRLKNLIETGCITLTTKNIATGATGDAAGTIDEPSFRVKSGQNFVICVPDAEPAEPEPQDIALDVIHEDDDLLVLNKPAGMVVHPAFNNWSGTLVNALTYHFRQLPTMKNNEGRPGLVHRIDKNTSGLLVIAKTEAAMKSLAKQFFDHSIKRTYLALVWGEPEKEEGIIDVYLGRSLKDRRVTAAFPDGDYGRGAITHYKVVQTLRYVSLLQCNLETGRTHQIRSHLKYIGHPLFNDATYGGDQILKGMVFSKYKAFVQNCFKLMPRQALHAKTLGFIHPETDEFVQFNSELPEDFSAVLEKWEGYVQHH